ncbi:hypothetical protein PoB_003387900 [Plakobranchus ocellatus]|uniref:Uncharacterized protein n=1 Tax=Plakobranchus ocellatus TaxID=259542 RepID=A0AAV4ALY5_9GAST|nr:hypothetical protein PoB_003387900 [Plakobranchus ocellatus]
MSDASGAAIERRRSHLEVAGTEIQPEVIRFQASYVSQSLSLKQPQAGCETIQRAVSQFHSLQQSQAGCETTQRAVCHRLTVYSSLKLDVKQPSELCVTASQFTAVSSWMGNKPASCVSQTHSLNQSQAGWETIQRAVCHRLTVYSSLKLDVKRFSELCVTASQFTAVSSWM